MNTMKKVLALTLALAMAFSLVAFGYTDDNAINADCVEAVNLLTALNILNGYSDGSIKPDNTISRAEAAKMIYVLCNRGVDDKAIVYQGVSNFTDVPANAWYAGYVNYAVNNKIIAGRGNGIFDPAAPVTGVELAKMLLNVAEYRTDVQGYTGSNWQSNVLKDAQYAGMLNNYSYGIGKAAPRQWAALLFANTILDVDVAQYIGDMLWTGGIGGTSNNSQTVGVKRLGLYTDEGILISNNKVAITEIADDDDGNLINSKNSVLVNESGRNITLKDFNAPVELLGQEVRVLFKAGNDTTTFDEIFGVYATGTSVVYNTTLDKITFTGKDDGKMTVEFEGYGKQTMKADEVVSFANNLYLNEYDVYGWENNTTAKTLASFLGNRAEDICLIDQDGDGILDLAFLRETEYYNVTRNNGKSAFTVAKDGNQSSVQLAKTASEYADLVINGTVDVDDIVAVTLDCRTGDKIYNITKIEPTSVKAESWTYGDGVIKTVKLDGTSYKLAQLANTSELNKDHKTYYLDKGFVVSSTDESLSANAPKNVAVITDVTIDENIKGKTDNWGNVTAPFEVKFIDENGKTITATYEIPTDERDNTDIIGQDATIDRGNIGWEDAKNLQAGALGDLAKATAQILRDSKDALVVYVLDGDKVYFKTLDSEIPTNMDIDYSTSNGNYYAANGRIKLDGVTYTSTADTFAFVKYTKSGDVKYTRMLLSELKGNVKDSAMEFLFDKDGNAIYGFIDLGSDNLPKSDSTAFAMLTGNYYVTEKTSSKHIVHFEGINASGEKVDLMVKYTGDGSPSNAEVKDYVDGLKNMLVAYTLDSDNYATFTGIDEYVADDKDRDSDSGDITTLDSKGFRLDGGYYDIASDIMVVVVSGDAGDETFTVGGAGDLMRISDSSSDPAYVVSVNGDDGVATAKIVVIATNGEDASEYVAYASEIAQN